MKKEAKKLTKLEVMNFNEVFSQVKVNGLPHTPCIDYLTLKCKTSEIVDAIGKSRTDSMKTILAELGYKEGEKIPENKVSEVNQKAGEVLEKLFKEEIDLDTHVLSSEDFFNCILNIEENKNMTTEQKATLMKYLVK